MGLPALRASPPAAPFGAAQGYRTAALRAFQAMLAALGLFALFGCAGAPPATTVCRLGDPWDPSAMLRQGWQVSRLPAQLEMQRFSSYEAPHVPPMAVFPDAAMVVHHPEADHGFLVDVAKGCAVRWQAVPAALVDIILGIAKGRGS